MKVNIFTFTKTSSIYEFSPTSTLFSAKSAKADLTASWAWCSRGKALQVLSAAKLHFISFSFFWLRGGTILHIQIPKVLDNRLESTFRNEIQSFSCCDLLYLLIQSTWSKQSFCHGTGFPSGIFPQDWIQLLQKHIVKSCRKSVCSWCFSQVWSCEWIFLSPVSMCLFAFDVSASRRESFWWQFFTGICLKSLVKIAFFYIC